ncbi:hypothetical protein THMIRHAM_20050 [Thiomicrorhabdus immobilis]|uniref:DUF2914 domain-containing protein n=1 Tax=Thiomicrorhabdus immobilis TaxID=2791037 RepID=A0ABM7MFF6_9GAMM|nr:DUF2914 domain-containing protein [Thiomicrorhabdus immobilis]BCN94220.1 hypothetical protein THMIRHAM_20050 [Thiomicrorhabdus immobilis]
MQLPDTDNIDYQYAFKQGYRMAIDGKRVTSMPSSVRRDMVMRDYFQQGWEQAVEDMTHNSEILNKPDWRSRFAWFVFMVLGGLATASLMIKNIESEKAKQQAAIEGQTAQTPSTQTSTLNTPNSATTVNEQHDLANLSLLSNEQRKDLALNQRQIATAQELDLQAVIDSPIKVTFATLSEDIQDRTPIHPLTDTVPKYIRKLTFFTEIKHANKQTIYHRWRTDKQILATVELSIGSDNYKTWSNKKLSSAWLGQWYVEVLDQNKNVIFRKAFNYGGQP